MKSLSIVSYKCHRKWLMNREYKMSWIAIFPNIINKFTTKIIYKKLIFKPLHIMDKNFTQQYDASQVSSLVLILFKIIFQKRTRTFEEGIFAFHIILKSFPIQDNLHQDSISCNNSWNLSINDEYSSNPMPFIINLHCNF